MKQLEFELTADLPIGESRLQPYTAYRYLIKINDIEYDLADIYETLEDIDHSYLHKNPMTDMLVELDVISYIGNSYTPAYKGMNFDHFFKKIEREYLKLHKKIEELRRGENELSID